MYKSIKELDIFISDGNYSSKYPRSDEFVDEGIPFIRGNNMIDGEIVDEDMYHINEKVAGAKMPRVSMSDFRKFDVPIPPMELQQEFAEFVAQVDKSKVAVQKALDEAQLLFDSLMQKYFG